MAQQALTAYDDLAAVYEEHFLTDELRTPAGAAAPFAALLTPGSRVLDCACGTGLVAAGLTADGFDVTASDASPGMVAKARARGVDATVRRWEDLPPADFDAVLCVGNSLAHARDRVTALAAMAAALRPGGMLVVTSRNWEAERARGSRTETQGAVTRTWTIPEDWDAPHLMHLEVGDVTETLTVWPFTPAQLDADLRAAGLEPGSSTFAPGAGRYGVTAYSRRLTD